LKGETKKEKIIYKNWDGMMKLKKKLYKRDKNKN
jgi:hypothetical protein